MSARQLTNMVKDAEFERSSLPQNLAETNRLPEIILYEHGNFNNGGNEDGWVFRTNLSYLNLGELNDQASSCIVVSGVWELFNNTHFDPAAGKWTLGPGYYPVFDGGATPLNDCLTSFRAISL